MNSITGCVLMKNEEKLLEGCLESLENIASGIIVVDNGSDDRSVEIANKHNCKILYSPNHLFFG